MQQFAVFTQSTTFEAMATTSNAGASFEEPHNIIHDDIACFSVAGHSGHMGDLNWSGFDPILCVFLLVPIVPFMADFALTNQSMLHHANIDRLYAMWQAINYNDPVFTSTQHGLALFGTAAGPVTADSPLRPFSLASSGDMNPSFHTSRSVESIISFGYTYPEIDDWSLAPADLANTVRVAINNLYGPQADDGNLASSKKKRSVASAKTTAGKLPWKLSQARRSWRWRRAAKSMDAVGNTRTSPNKDIAVDKVHGSDKHKISPTTAAGNFLPTPVHNAPILDNNDYSIEIGVDRSQLPLPCIIELHLLGADQSSNGGNGYSRKSAKIGSTSILSMPQTGTSYSTTPLRRVLVREATRHRAPAVFNDSADILIRLRDIAVVIRTVCINLTRSTCHRLHC